MSSAFTPGSASTTVTKVELTISCRNLHDADIFSKSDPIVIVQVQEAGSNKYREYGRTEIIWDNLNPDFEKKFLMEYHFEVHKMLRFLVYDVDDEIAMTNDNLDKQDFLGMTECSLGEIVTGQAGKGDFECGLMNKTGGLFKGGKGNIIIRSEELVQSRKQYEIDTLRHI